MGDTGEQRMDSWPTAEFLAVFEASARDAKHDVFALYKSRLGTLLNIAAFSKIAADRYQITLKLSAALMYVAREHSGGNRA
jgi:hypothetical protein